jgi:hypothetical protein
MAHYAFIDANNVVTEVIVGIDETELIEGIDPEVWYGNFRGQQCVRTSYNGNIRKQYAGIGYTYDHVRDEFVHRNHSSRGLLTKITIGNHQRQNLTVTITGMKIY